MHGNRFNQNTLNTEITDGYTRVSDLDHYATLVYRQAGRMSPLYPCSIIDTGEVFLRGHDVFAFQKVDTKCFHLMKQNGVIFENVILQPSL